MKLISLWEPWATLMAIGAKKIETRSWSTPFRGWLAIHASKGGLSKRDLADCLAEPSFAKALRDVPISPGKIVAVVRLVDCRPTVDMIADPAFPSAFRRYPGLDTPQERAFGDFTEGRWGWVTEAGFRLPDPIPFRASQGLCEVPPSIVDAIRRQWMEERTSLTRLKGAAGAGSPIATPATEETGGSPVPTQKMENG